MSTTHTLRPEWLVKAIGVCNVKGKILQYLINYAGAKVTKDIMDNELSLNPEVSKYLIEELVDEGVITWDGKYIRLYGNPWGITSDTSDIEQDKKKLQEIWCEISSYKNSITQPDVYNIEQVLKEMLKCNPIPSLMNYEIRSVCSSCTPATSTHQTSAFIFVFKDYSIITYSLKWGC